MAEAALREQVCVILFAGVLVSTSNGLISYFKLLI